MSDTRVAAEIEPEFATRGACAFARWAQEERKMREVLAGHSVAGHLREAQVVLRSVAEPARSYNLHKLTLTCIK